MGSRRAEPGSARGRVTPPPAEKSSSYTAAMELRDGDLVLRPWTEDDVDAIVAGCNDPEVARWIPTIPHPYTAEHARAFLNGETAPATIALRSR